MGQENGENRELSIHTRQDLYCTWQEIMAKFLWKRQKRRTVVFTLIGGDQCDDKEEQLFSSVLD